MLTEHDDCDNPLVESLEAAQERCSRSSRTAARLQSFLRREVCSGSEQEGSQFELELRSTLA